MWPPLPLQLAVEAAGDGCSAKMVAQEAVQEAAADKEGGDGGAGGKSKNKDSEEDQGTTDSRDKHEDNEQSRKSSAESHERKTEERSGANTSGSTTSTSGSSGDQPEDNSENTENDKSATSKRERNQQNGGSQSLEGGPAGSNAHEEGSKGPERRDEPANSDYGGALATASADRNNEAEARTENGGSGNRTGKRCEPRSYRSNTQEGQCLPCTTLIPVWPACMPAYHTARNLFVFWLAEACWRLEGPLTPVVCHCHC
jgi:hypothetical protein